MAQTGVQETKEVLTAMVEAVAVARRLGSDGWSLDDIGLVIRDQALIDKLATALDGAGNIPAELSSLTFSETMEIVMALVDAAKALSR
jgi:hypothetical protein